MLPLLNVREAEEENNDKYNGMECAIDYNNVEDITTSETKGDLIKKIVCCCNHVK